MVSLSLLLVDRNVYLLTPLLSATKIFRKHKTNINVYICNISNCEEIVRVCDVLKGLNLCDPLLLFLCQFAPKKYTCDNAILYLHSICPKCLKALSYGMCIRFCSPSLLLVAFELWTK